MTQRRVSGEMGGAASGASRVRAFDAALCPGAAFGLRAWPRPLPVRPCHPGAAAALRLGAVPRDSVHTLQEAR